MASRRSWTGCEDLPTLQSAELDPALFAVGDDRFTIAIEIH